ncbi:hypothetical protein EYC56_09885 [Xanthomonas oryzae]|nr:hypothetical protein EYC56_09885 [Xanthomonas oryzae]
MTGNSKSVEPTDQSGELKQGRLALWLDLDDLRWLASNCSCTDSAPDELRERCSRIRFRANAALHKAGLKAITVDGAET